MGKHTHSEYVEIPLTHSQEQIWLAEQLAPSLSVYGVPIVVELFGGIDVELVSRCVTEIARRHESLRSRVVEEGGELRAVIDPPAPVHVSVVNLEDCPDHNVRGLIDAATRRPFDLARDRLLRVHVIHVKPTEHVLLFNIHHICFDGWSLGVLWAEFSELYSAWWHGRAPDLPEILMQYRDYAARQREVVDGGGANQQLDYWARQLEDSPVSLSLPNDGEFAMRSYQGTHLRLGLSGALRAAVLDFARRHGVTPFAVTLAGWAALLGRYTQQDDVLIGSPLACRARPELENMIGLFVNTLPLRLRPTADKQFAQLVREAFCTTVDAVMNQDAPFVKVAERVRPARKLGQSPLFQTAFSYDSLPFKRELPNLVVKSMYEASTGASRFALSVDVIDAHGQLGLQIEYDAQLFTDDTVGGLASSLATLLTDATQHPSRSLGSLRLSSARSPLPGGHPAWPAPNLTLHGLFEKQVSRTPRAPAIEQEDGRAVSYGALNGGANQLARHLRSQGLAVGGRVAIAIKHRSMWPLAILAALKAGAAYVPVDPAGPPGRNARMLEQALPELVIADGASSDAACLRPFRKVVVDDPVLWSHLERGSRENLASNVTGTHAAYIPFTSGSTGKPKGTLLSHTNLVSYTLSGVDAYDLTSHDRFLQLAAITFDVHVEEIFPALASGGTVVFFDGDISRTLPNDLFTLLERRKITLCELPTPFWIALVDVLGRADMIKPRHLRRLLLGGERAPSDVYSRWLSLGVPLTNVYGLTETAVTSTTHVPELPKGDALPIGRPMGHAAVYLLDDSHTPVSPGFPGEVFIGGPGVCDGLLNLPDITADRFRPDPFANRHGARMYRTGDIARLNTDGDLEFLGRCDHQLKIRGHRVEPGEIEKEFERYPHVTHAVVLPSACTGGGDVALHAYVAGTGLQEADVLAYIRKRLPAHMVPARVTVVDKMPLTSHGKINRGALPGVDVVATPPRREQPVMSDLQRRLSSIYRDQLGTDEIALDDDIFDLGGHSLMALRLIARISQEFEVDIPIIEFIERSSISAVSTFIASAPTH